MSARDELVDRLGKAVEAGIHAEFGEELKTNRVLGALMKSPEAITTAAEAAANALVEVRVRHILQGSS